MTLAGIAVLNSMAGRHISASTQRTDARIGQTMEDCSYLGLWASTSAPWDDDGKPGTSGDNVVCSLDVADWDLAKVLRVLSQQTNVNVITMSAPDKKLTIRLADVKLSEMIHHICAITGMASIKTGSTYVIAAPDQLKASYPLEWAAENPAPPADPMAEISADIYMCSYVNSTQIADTLKKLFEDQKLVVLAGPQQQVPTLDAVDSSNGTGQTSTMLGTGATTGTGGGAPTGGSTTNQTTLAGRTILIRGPKPIVEAALRLAHDLDRPQPQVSIAVRVDDISNDSLKDLGLQWSFSDVSVTESKGNGFNFGRFDRSPLGFNAAISALEQKNIAKLLAEPNISVLDGEKAMILIGSRLNFPQLIGYSNANTPIFDRQEVRVGIYLQVSASITDTGEVTLSLYPQVSTVSGFLNVNGASYPQISTREAQTTLRLHSGQTVVMGGLLQDQDLVETEKVPILGEIPILGELFKHRKTTHNKSQVIISITPIVLKNPK
ncbi:MAG TPA: type II and III secretion system protein [Fimbriimonadaceae bacterium]|nr:type II and III secretion system protein [Fimbriimonadaceae bacterium]